MSNEWYDPTAGMYEYKYEPLEEELNLDLFF